MGELESYFHVTIHPLPEDKTSGRVGQKLQTSLQSGRGNTSQSIHSESQVADASLTSPGSMPSFAFTFEEVYAALEELPRLFIEPDGSFVWTSASDEGCTWQVDGMLYDAHGRLQFMELKGNCSVAAFDQLLATLRWPERSLAFYFVEQGTFVDEDTFRCRWLRAEK